jgi:hypothetical protein
MRERRDDVVLSRRHRVFLLTSFSIVSFAPSFGRASLGKFRLTLVIQAVPRRRSTDSADGNEISVSRASWDTDIPSSLAHALHSVYTQTRSGSRVSSRIVLVLTVNIRRQTRQFQR